MSIIDTIIVISYLTILIFIAYLLSKNNKNQEDYFLAGRSMPWFAVALSVSATMISANSFIGGPGWAYTDGMFPFMVNITVPIAVFFALFITVPIMYKLRVVSIYQYMNYRFGALCRILTVLQFFINSLIQVSSMIFIPSIVIQSITGWELNIIVPVIVLVSVAYTLIGGLKAVIWTDAIQMFIVWGGITFIIFTALKKIDMSFFDSINYAKEMGKLNTLNFTFNLKTPNTFWVTLIGGSIMWIRYFCFDQVQIQRILSAKSMKSLKCSLLTSAFIMNITYFLMLFIGIILFVFYKGRHFDYSNNVMINFILENLPVGVIGIVIAGVFASAMSSIDSILNSITTVFVKDIFEEYFTRDKKEASFKVTITISIVFGIIVTFFVLIGFKGNVKSVLDVVGSYISYFSGPATGLFLLAIFTKKSNDKGAALGFILGFLIGFYIAKTYKVYWLINPAIGSFFTFIFGYIISCFINEKNKNKYRYTIFGVKESIINSGNINEGSASLLPFKFDIYSIITLVFFALQYVVLILIQYL